MSEIKIEKGIPLKKTVTGGYPFADMEVGDSFLVPDKTAPLNVRVRAIQFCQKSYECREWKFSIKKVENNRYRCWRIK